MMAAGTVDWVNEALFNAFGSNAAVDSEPHQKQPPKAKAKAQAWAEKPVLPAAVQVPSIEASSRSKQDTRQWVEQWKLLNRREGLVAAEVFQGAGEWLRELREMQEEASASVAGVAQLKRKAWGDLHALRHAVSRVKDKLADVQSGPSYVVALSGSIDEVDGLLAGFKRWQAGAIAELDAQEAALEEEIDAAAFRIEDEMTAAAMGVSTSSPGPAAAQRAGVVCTAPASRRATQDSWAAPRTQPAAGPQARPVSSGPRGQGMLAPEVAEFEAFVLAHGETGGWEAHDHEEFMNILKACGGDYAAAVRVTMEQGVGFTKADIMQHARWHMDYMDLLVRKRMALAAWRAKRDAQRTKARTEAALYEPPTAVAAAQEHTAAAHACADTARDAAVKKELVAGWKVRREAAQRAAADSAAARQREAEARRELERAERQHFNRLKLELHQEAKENMQRELARRAAAAEHEARALQALTPAQAAAVAARSAETVRRRAELVQAKDTKARAREVAQSKILEKVHVEGAADPSRLLRGTTAHLARVAEARDAPKQRRDSGFILQPHQRLAVPTWRAGIS